MDERQVGANNSAGGCSTTEIQFRAATLKRHTPISKPIDPGWNMVDVDEGGGGGGQRFNFLAGDTWRHGPIKRQV